MMRLSLNRIGPTALALAGALSCGSAAEPAGAARVERRLGSMGTWLDLAVEAPTRAQAVRASELAVQAIEATERRLSTWSDASELAYLNRAPVGESFELSSELARDLAAAQRWWRATDGAFDPAVGGLIAAWDLRGSGRVPSAAELRSAWPAGGLATLELVGSRAVRLDAALWLEEGGFGKGSALDAALRALASAGATRAWLDLGGQVAVHGAEAQPVKWAIAHPQRREEVALQLPLASGSLATSGNSERAIEVEGARYGHLLDPRTGLPAADFGSLSVYALDAFSADCLSTGLYVLGPERALEFGRSEPEIDVLVLEPASGGRLRARATGALSRALEVVGAVDLERIPDDPPAPSRAAASGAELSHVLFTRP
jgi:thiamine biosynthesis lipoprotein